MFGLGHDQQELLCTKMISHCQLNIGRHCKASSISVLSIGLACLHCSVALAETSDLLAARAVATSMLDTLPSQAAVCKHTPRLHVQFT